MRSKAGITVHSHTLPPRRQLVLPFSRWSRRGGLVPEEARGHGTSTCCSSGSGSKLSRRRGSRETPPWVPRHSHETDWLCLIAMTLLILVQLEPQIEQNLLPRRII